MLAPALAVPPTDPADQTELRSRRLHAWPRRPRSRPAGACPAGPADRTWIVIPRHWLWRAERLAEFSDRITLVEAVYDELPAVLARFGRPKVQGILLDLGVSSLQIDDPERGFAYAQDAPLDMRMGSRSSPRRRSSIPTRELSWRGSCEPTAKSGLPTELPAGLSLEREREPFALRDARPAAL